MIHTGHFEIAIPKEFLKESTPERDKRDFFFKVTAQYSCYTGGHRLTIDRVTIGFTAAKFIQWDNPELEKYLLSAAANNHTSYFEPMEDVANISQQGNQC